MGRRSLRVFMDFEKTARMWPEHKSTKGTIKKPKPGWKILEKRGECQSQSQSQCKRQGRIRSLIYRYRAGIHKQRSDTYQSGYKAVFVATRFTSILVYSTRRVLDFRVADSPGHCPPTAASLELGPSLLGASRVLT